MTTEQEALRQGHAPMATRDEAAAMLRKLVAEREEYRAAMRRALEALEHTVAWNDDEISPSFVVECRAAITDLRQRLEGTT